jgi:hypothetical protein
MGPGNATTHLRFGGPYDFVGVLGKCAPRKANVSKWHSSRVAVYPPGCLLAGAKACWLGGAQWNSSSCETFSC